MNLDDVEQLKRVIVQPMVDTIDERLKAHIDSVNAIVDGGMKKVTELDGRVKNLEVNQKKALLGWGAITVGTGLALTASWNYLKRVVHIG